MNEQIEKLAQDCFIHGEKEFAGKVVGFNYAKFAELIVKEVLDEVLQAMDDGMDVYDTVADKFGVEE